MQITSNTTGMEAGIAMAVDKDGRDHAVVVVKATFIWSERGGGWKLAPKQEPLVTTDAHFGDPATSSIKYECDFARIKPRADIIVIGHAHAPRGEPVGQVDVKLEVDDVISKGVCVFGDRKWEAGLMGLRSSEPVPFVKMPLVYEKAFGGSDHTHDDPKCQGSELRNLVGVGFRKNADPQAIEGSPLPNLEHPSNQIKKWSDTPPPVSLGVVGRGWQPRIGFAGTYDEKWMKERLPFLPEDFDERYFNSAAEDQQVASLKGGETVRCTNMTASGSLTFVVPRVKLPVVYAFRDGQLSVQPVLDTVIVETDKPQVMLVWRASVPLGRKMNALLEVLVGVPMREMSAKRRFDSLAEMIASRKENK